MSQWQIRNGYLERVSGIYWVFGNIEKILHDFSDNPVTSPDPEVRLPGREGRSSHSRKKQRLT